jgi:hypothetical protein
MPRVPPAGGEPGEVGRAVLGFTVALASACGALGDDELALLWEIMREAEHAVCAAIDGQRARGATWPEIGARVGAAGESARRWRERRSGADGTVGGVDGSGDTPAQRAARHRRAAS